jgi:hypothetical protein
MNVQYSERKPSLQDLVPVADRRNRLRMAGWKVTNEFPGKPCMPIAMLARSILIASALAGFLSATSVFAAVCASTPAQLDAALTTAASNGVDDDIRVVVGSYLLTAGLVYDAVTSETNKLSVSGGWAAGCLIHAESGETTLDGQDLVRPLLVYTFGPTTVRRLNFVRGKHSDSAGGGLAIGSTNAADLTIESNAFVNNEPLGGRGGGIFMATSGTTILRNNLFFFNTGSTSAAYVTRPTQAAPTGPSGLPEVYVTGNTFVANQLVNGVGFGALVLAGPNQYRISNNIFWNNQGIDVYDYFGLTDYRNNDIGAIDGHPPLSMIGNVNVNPMFDGFLSTRLKPSSPLVNAGLDSAPGGLGVIDESGAARRVGLHVDIGAFETDVLLRTGFESPPSPPEIASH